MGFLEDYGAKTANALGEGVDKFFEQRKNAQEQALRQKQQDMQEQAQNAQMMQAGMQKDLSGQWQQNPQVAQNMQLEAKVKGAGLAREQEAYDPNSAYSAQRREYTRGLLNNIKPGQGGFINDNMSAKDLEGKEGLLPEVVKGQYGVLGRDYTNQWKQRYIDLGYDRLGQQKTNQSEHAANVFDKDPILQQGQKQMNAIQRGQHTLETTQVITPQIFDEIQMDIANAISGGRASAVSTQNKVAMESLNTEWANLKQRLTGRPQDINDPEFKKQASDVMARLGEAYQQTMADRADQISAGRTKIKNSEYQDVLNAKKESFQKKPAGIQSAPGGSPPDFKNMSPEMLKAYIGS